jgi:pyruvate kinase
MTHRTKIVVTIGPASAGEETIRKIIQLGMNVARLNFSHGEYPEHAARYQRIRDLSRSLGKPVAIMQDLQGPKIRTGKLPAGGVNLVAGQPLKIVTSQVIGDETTISVDFPELPRYVKPGSSILLADGQMELVVTGKDDTQVHTEIVLGGTLTDHKGVNLPGANLDIPGFTAKDADDLAFGLELGVDAVAISFVRRAEDVSRVREQISKLNPSRIDTPLIAKLERPEAMENLDAILEVADGVMVARGDLGVEMAPEMVPIAQKRIIEAANRSEKVVITATQMLESMIHNPRPTRAEASDVANAIFDGTDAVMLSGETAIGDYPIKTVEMMDAIIAQAELNLQQWGRWRGSPLRDTHDDAYFVTLAGCEMAHDRNVTGMAVFTESGRTALLMSKARPDVPILSFTPDERAYRRMALYWGVTPYQVPTVDNVEAMLKVVESTILDETPLLEGQQVVLICGFPVGAMRPPNLALLYTLGDQTPS